MSLSLGRFGMLRRAGLLLLGSVGSQGIAFALSPVLTRLYGPAEFGILGVFTATTSLVGSVASLGLEAAIVVERDLEQARYAYGLSLVLAVAVSLATTFAAVAVHLMGWAGSMSWPESAMIPISVLSLGCGQVVVGRALALDRTLAVAAGRFMRAAGVGLTQIALAMVATTGETLVVGAVVGQVAACMTVLLLLRSTPGPLFGTSGFGIVVRRHKSLLGWTAPQTLLSNLAVNTVPMVLAGRFAEAVVGAFSLANRIVLVPAVTIGEAMRQSLLKSASDVSDDAGALFMLLSRSTALLGAGLGAVSLTGWIWAPELFALAFGERWRTAGSYAALLLIAQAAGIANIPAVTAVTVCRLQRPFFVLQVSGTAARLGALVWGGASDDAWLALASFTGASVLSSVSVTLWVGTWLWRRRLLKGKALA